MPTAMKTHSTTRAATKPRARISLTRLTTGYSTTAVPMFAMMRSSSKNAPRTRRCRRQHRRRCSEGHPPQGRREKSWGIEVINVIRNNTPVTLAIV